MIRVNLELCSGCKRCMLACSFYKTGGFNPRYSSILIRTDIGNKPISYSLRECVECRSFYCVEFCTLEAIETVP